MYAPARWPVVFALFIICVLTPLARATEGGGTSKALGVDTVLSGVMPPPGALNIMSFTAFYSSDSVRNDNGDAVPRIRDFDLFVFAEVLRFRYVLPKVDLLGANVELRFGWTLGNEVDLSFDLATPRRLLHIKDSTVNVGDSLGGLILGWHSEHFHQMFGPEVFLPTGRFEAGRRTNTSRGYYSIGPSYWFTWFPIEQIEVSGALIYLINFENPDTHYLSGQELSFDYNLGYFITPDWEAGLSGYAYKQVTDDELNGRTVSTGNRGQVVAYGPALRWHPHGKNFGVTLKWQHEEMVENRTSGDRFFLQASVQF